MVPGFEPTTFGNESPPITNRPGLPPHQKLVTSFILSALEGEHLSWGEFILELTLVL